MELQCKQMIHGIDSRNQSQNTLLFGIRCLVLGFVEGERKKGKEKKEIEGGKLNYTMSLFGWTNEKKMNKKYC